MGWVDPWVGLGHGSEMVDLRKTDNYLNYMCM